jgi:hypothetical protein
MKEWFMIGKASRLAVAAAVVLATLLVPTQAYAADGCGDGWFKQSDGYLERVDNWQGNGGRAALTYHTGRVRFCTDDDTWDNDENRRALIGYPSDSYPFQSQVFKYGSWASFCVKQTISAHMTGIKSSDGWTIGGSVSKDSPSVSFSYSATYDTVTVNVAKTKTCGAAAKQIIEQTSGITVTADNETGKVEWVMLTTQITGEYTYNGVKYAINHSVMEHDYS